MNSVFNYRVFKGFKIGSVVDVADNTINQHETSHNAGYFGIYKADCDTTY
jgi:hypothetical protein